MKRLKPSFEDCAITVRFTPGAGDAADARAKLLALATALGRRAAQAAWDTATAASGETPESGDTEDDGHG